MPWARSALPMNRPARAAGYFRDQGMTACVTRASSPCADHHSPAKDSSGETAFNMLMDRIVNKREGRSPFEVHRVLSNAVPLRMVRFRDYRR